MKFKDFLERLEFIAELHETDIDDLVVVVRTDDQVLAGLNNTAVEDVYAGFDWEKGKVVITTKDKLRRSL